MTALIRRISHTAGAIAIFGILSTTVAAAAPVTTASSTTVDSTGATDVAQAGPLSDVPLNSWAYDAVAQLAKDGIIKGYPGGTFKGNRPMTRYEAAVLAYRAVDMIEAQITAGKQPVPKVDMDAANKLMAAFGDELKAVERHVDDLQKQAEATNALVAATAATVRKQQIHLLTTFRVASYSQNIQANAGPLPEVFNGVTYAPGSALPSGIGTAPTGTSVHGPTTTPSGIVTPGAGAAGGLAWGPQSRYGMGQNGNTIGQYGHGLGSQHVEIEFEGSTDNRSKYLVQLANLDIYSGTNFYPQVMPAFCMTPTVGVAAAPCTSANSSPLLADGILNNLVRLQNMWYEYTSPGGIYAKIGKFQQDEGPKQGSRTAWGMADYVNGARIGYRTARFNAQVGYGFEDTAAQNNLIYGLPFTSHTMWAQADYQFDHGRTDIGAYSLNYSGYHQLLWDAAAVNCVGSTPATAGLSKTLPLLAGQSYATGGCGTGYNPIVYGAPGAAAGLPVTGAYISTGPGAQAPHEDTVGLFAVENYGQLRLVLEGTDRLGTDPTTGSRWKGNVTGFFQADYGPYRADTGVRGKYTAELGGFAAGMNGLRYYANTSLWAQFSTNYADYYFLFAGVKKYVTDTAYLGIWYVNMGLLPNTVIPAGSAQCPGCVISGDHRNAVYTELNMSL